MTRHIVWIKERGKATWEEQGDGPLTLKQAERIAKEIRKECGVPTKVLPAGSTPREIVKQ